MAFIYVGLGGFLGSCLRYLITIIIKNSGIFLPLSTLFSNVIASFLIGFIMGIERQTNLITPQNKLFLTTGLLGGLSTFSTFSLETMQLFYAGKYWACILNILSNLSLCFLSVALGFLLAKLVFEKI